MKYTLSKRVFNGSLVRRRGTKYIVCGKGQRPHGLYRTAHQEVTKIYTMDGKRTEIKKDFPEGVAYWGPTIVIGA